MSNRETKNLFLILFFFLFYTYIFFFALVGRVYVGEVEVAK
jgi:hypothetical protein